ncbi:hypothetical protein BGZ76_007289 [Entomortierella beljakovae]|nr:hypothetical protein BGZ76_007289 [Entomortierella beljakovae]
MKSTSKRRPSTQHQEQKQQRITRGSTQSLTNGQPIMQMTLTAGPKSPFEIEEVVYEIVSNLDKSSICSCVFVSKVFYHASIKALWTSVQWKNFAWTDSYLSEFERYGHYTTELNEIYNADLDRIARVCTNLRSLRLSWTSITDEKLSDIIQSSPRISRLYLFSCRTLTSLSLLHISSLTRLEHLELKNMVLVDENAIVGLLKSCAMLDHLALEDVRLDGITLNNLDSIPLNLKTLTLTRSSPTGSFIKNILRNAPMIRELSMARNSFIVLFKEDLLPLFDMCKHISSLNLDSCKRIDSEAIITLIHACPGLERVNMCKTRIDDLGLEALTVHCTNVTSLSLSWSPFFTDCGLLKVLTSCHSLKFLDISTHEVTTANIFSLKTPWACLALETLILVGVDMTRPHGSVQNNHAMMFSQLSRLESLHDLAIGGANLELKLEAGLSKMERLSCLETFSISHLQTELCEDEIRWMIDEAWPNLKRVRFNPGSLPIPWLRYFRRQRPHLVIDIK